MFELNWSDKARAANYYYSPQRKKQQQQKNTHTHTQKHHHQQLLNFIVLSATQGLVLKGPHAVDRKLKSENPKSSQDDPKPKETRPGGKKKKKKKRKKKDVRIVKVSSAVLLCCKLQTLKRFGLTAFCQRDSWSKGWEFESRQKQRENFLLQS